VFDEDDLPPGWLLTTVNSVGAVKLGRAKSPNASIGFAPEKYIRTANVTGRGLDLSDVREMNFTPEELTAYSLKIGDVLIVDSSGSASQVGRAALWRGELESCCYQNHIIRFRPHAAQPEYAFTVFRYYFMANVFEQLARGVGIQHLGASRFSSLPFPLAPVDVQLRIAAEVARRTNDLREAEDSLNSALENIAEQNKEILLSAIDGTLTGDEPVSSEAFVHTVPSAILDSYQWIWPLPREWRWVQVEDIAEIRLGRQRSPEHQSGPYMRPYLRVANVLEDRIDASNILEMNFTPEEYEIYSLRDGDVLLNDGQSPELVGRPAIYRGEVPGACFQNHIIRFRAAPTVDPDYALLVFRAYLHSGRFRSVARWTTNIATLSLKRFGSMPFPLPPLAIQRAIASDAKERFEASVTQEEAVRASLGRLPSLEREMLELAVTGELVDSTTRGESASTLLERVGLPPKEPRLQRAVQHTPPHEIHGDLGDVLVRAERALPLPDLYLMAGFDKDEPAQVEQFYLQLRDEIDRTVRSVSNADENAVLEVIRRETN
jgi:restriction endonuclease S subunit